MVLVSKELLVAEQVRDKKAWQSKHQESLLAGLQQLVHIALHVIPLGLEVAVDPVEVAYTAHVSRLLLKNHDPGVQIRNKLKVATVVHTTKRLRNQIGLTVLGLELMYP